MYQLNLPNSPTALRLGSKFLADLAEQAETVQAELGSRVAGELKYAVKLDTSLAELLPQEPERELEVATPAPGDLRQQLGEPTEDPKPTADSAMAPASSTVTQTSAPAVAATPEPELRFIYDEAAAGYPLDAMRASGWTDDQLVAAGYAAWEEVPVAAPLAPSAPVPPAPPAPPAPATVPSASNSSASTLTASGAVDSAGLPWDERIHASTKTTVADGTWRKKKGVSPELIAAVEAELLGKPAAATSGPMVPPAPTVPASVPVPPVASADADPRDFQSLVQWILPHTKNGKLSQTDVQLAVMGLGIEGVNMLPHLSQHLDRIPEVVAKLREKAGA